MKDLFTEADCDVQLADTKLIHLHTANAKHRQWVESIPITFTNLIGDGRSRGYRVLEVVEKDSAEKIVADLATWNSPLNHADPFGPLEKLVERARKLNGGEK